MIILSSGKPLKDEGIYKHHISIQDEKDNTFYMCLNVLRCNVYGPNY